MKPKLLWDELKRYGYVFSVKRGNLMNGMVEAFAIVCGKFFRLDHMYLFLLCLWCACLFPFFLRNLYRNRYGQRQFVEINSYMEQFLYSFQKSGKILVTLKDVEKLFANGVMHTRIQEAIAYIEDTYDEDYECYTCEVDLDEDEMAHFMQDTYYNCPYFQMGDEYKIVRKQM